MSRYQLKHAFTAEEAGELSCAKSEVVMAVGNQNSSDDGWLFVSVDGDPSRSGYVPLSFLEPVTVRSTVLHTPMVHTPSVVDTLSPASKYSEPPKMTETYLDPPPVQTQPFQSATPNVVQMADTSSPTTDATKLGPIRRFSDIRLAAHLEEVGKNSSSPKTASPSPTKTTSDSMMVVPGNSGSLRMPMPTIDINDDFNNLISLHDDWLKNMQTAHQDAFRGMVNAVDDLGGRVSACQEKNNQIVDQMNMLDALIEDERMKWKQRLDTEKAAMTNRIAKMYADTNTAAVEANSISE